MEKQDLPKRTYAVEHGFNVSESKAVCFICGKSMGILIIVNSGVSHVMSAQVTCLECMQRVYDEGRVPEDARGFVRRVLQPA